MKCKGCGAFIDEATQKYCPSCGELIEKKCQTEDFSEQNSRTEDFSEQNSRTVDFVEQKSQTEEPAEKMSWAEDYAEPEQGAQGTAFPWPTYPMAWYKFLIYFSLFAGAVISLVSGLMYITGAVYGIYGGSGALVYGLFGNGLRAVDMLYGLTLCLLAGLFIVTRFKLSKYKKEGPKFLYATYIIDGILPIIYSIAATVATDVTMLDGSETGSVLGLVVLIICNYKYFKKREKLFVN